MPSNDISSSSKNFDRLASFSLQQCLFYLPSCAVPSCRLLLSPSTALCFSLLRRRTMKTHLLCEHIFYFFDDTVFSIMYYVSLICDEPSGRCWPIHLAVDKINKVTTGKQAMRGCKPWPMENKHCVGENHG